MRSPGAAIAWEFRQRHRLGLIGVTAYLLLLAAIKLLLLAGGHAVNLDSAQGFAFALLVPLSAAFMYCMAVFSFGLDGDVAARQSMYPARMFTRPVTTAALVGWPMVYGTAVMAIIWTAIRLFALWPSGFDIPVIWPGLLAASLIAWIQALTWMPYALPGLRVLVSVLSMTVIDVVVFVALEHKVPEAVMLAILAPHLPLAYLVARMAVARARRGDVPDWRGTFAWRAQRAAVVPDARTAFRSPSRAQSWFEWRSHGRSLPALVGIVLPFELGLLFLFADTPALVLYTLAGVLVTPPFMAGFVSATVSTSNPDARDFSGVSPFLAARPVSTSALIAAKLKASIWSTAAAWLLILAAIPLALVLSGTWPVVIERARQLRDAIGAPRAAAIGLLGLSGLIVWTWKRLVQNLYIGLTGRAWLIKGSVFLTLVILGVLGPILHWIAGNKGVQAALLFNAPSIAAVLAAVKMAAAAWIVARLYRSRLLSDRALVTGAACWCVAVLTLYAVLVWFADSPLVPRYGLALVAMLAIPLARLSAAPLALSWNRHR